MKWIITFPSVRCKNQTQNGRCSRPTRLPLPMAEPPELAQINSPSETQPLLVLCDQCWQITRYTSPDDLEPMPLPKSATDTMRPLFCIDIECGELNCGLHTTIFLRTSALLSDKHAIGYTIEALGGLDARCSKGHLLNNAKKSVHRYAEYPNVASQKSIGWSKE